MHKKKGLSRLIPRVFLGDLVKVFPLVFDPYLLPQEGVVIILLLYVPRDPFPLSIHVLNSFSMVILKSALKSYVKP